MSIIIFLLIVSLAVAVSFLIGFMWSAKTGQFDDAYSPAHRILFEDKIDENTKNS